MIVDCISDLHGHYPQLEGGDLLIVAGDLTASDRFRELYDFCQWMRAQDYKKKIVISGNHDNHLQELNPFDEIPIDFVYLFDSGTEFEGLKIWGSPWTKTFDGMNPRCMAFTVDTDKKLAQKWAMIPEDTDILITHCPPWGIMDMVTRVTPEGIRSLRTGSKSLANKVGKMDNPPKLWVWGHIHQCYGIDPTVRKKQCIMVNASHMDEYYDPVNKPIRVIL
jgi:Icc-related predicted phosphoesterase